MSWKTARIAFTAALRAVSFLLAVTGLALTADIISAHWPLRCLNKTVFTLSFELSNAPCAATADLRTMAWLKGHRRAIRTSASRYRIDPVAIAAAIGYEATSDVHWSTVFGLTRSIGPGKVHYKQGYLREGDPVARQVERLHYVTPISMRQRKRELATSTEAIKYIAVIMRALANEVQARTGDNVSRSPDTLAAIYTEFDIPGTRLFFVSTRRPLERIRSNPAALWTREHLLALRGAIGPGAGCNMSRFGSARPRF